MFESDREREGFPIYMNLEVNAMVRCWRLMGRSESTGLIFPKMSSGIFLQSMYRKRQVEHYAQDSAFGFRADIRTAASGGGKPVPV